MQTSLPVESSELLPGKLYALLCQTQPDALLLLQLFSQVDTPRIIVVQSHQNLALGGLSKGQSSLVRKLIQASESSWFWPDTEEGDIARDFDSLLDEVKRLHPRHGRHILLCTPESAFDGLTEQSLEARLEAFAEWADKRDVAVLFLIHGEYHHLRRRLIASHALSGAAFCQSADDTHLSYHLLHWSSGMGVHADREWLLWRSADGELTALHEIGGERGGDPTAPMTSKVPRAATVPQPGADDGIIFATKASVADGGDSSLLPPEFAPLAEDNVSLLAQLADVETATIVLDCNSLERAKEVGAQCYQLRRRYGAGLKIVVRETQDCLRYAEEHYLLLAGVNLLVPHSVVFSLFLTQLAALEGQWFYRDIPANLDALLDNWPRYAVLGYVDARVFVDQCRSAFDQAINSDTDSVLIQLTPARDISDTDCLPLCQLRRTGDAVTAVDGQLYMLFRACRLNDAHVALKNSFSLPADELFRSYQFFIEDDEVEQALGRINQGDTFIDSTTGRRLMRPGSGDPSVNTLHATGQSFTAGYARLSPLPLD